jgi:hypothetical protein
MKTSNYLSEVSDPRVTGRSLHSLSDLLLIGLCTFLTGGSDYQDMRLFGLECGSSPGDLLSLPNGVPSETPLNVYSKVFIPMNRNPVYMFMVIIFLQTCPINKSL